MNENGFWRWDGGRWQPQAPADLDATRLVDELERLAAGWQIRRGELLVQRLSDWRPPEALAARAREARQLMDRRDNAGRRLQDLDARPRQGIAAWVSRIPVRLNGGTDERQRIWLERDDLSDTLRPLLLEIGRAAPAPTFRESEKAMEMAARISRTASRISAVNAALAAAQAEWQLRVQARQFRVQEAMSQREHAIAQAQAAIEDAHAAREQAIVDGWSRLALALVLTLGHGRDESLWYIDVLPSNGVGELSPWPIDQIPTGLPRQRRPDEQTLQEIASCWARRHGCG